MFPIRSFSGEAALGAGLIATPWWAQWLHMAAGIAGDIAAICGLIIGIHAVYRLIRNRNKDRAR